MPKIIPDIEDKILIAAKKLFSKHKYRDIEMKEIAKEAGIAVGTLYNYFSNKQTLYYKIFEDSWQSTYLKLEKIISMNVDSIEKLKQYMKVAYDEIEKKGQLGIQLAQSSSIEDPARHREFFAQNEIIIMLCDLFKEIRIDYKVKLEETMDGRFAETCILMIIDSIIIHPMEKEKNLMYITEVVTAIAGA